MTQQDHLAVATLLNLLFEYVRAGDGQTITQAEMARVTGISSSAITALRRAVVTNPGLDHIRAISHFFGVPLDYWGARSEAEAVSMIQAALRGNASDTSLATRLTNLSDEARHDLERILDWVQRGDRPTRQDSQSERSND